MNVVSSRQLLLCHKTDGNLAAYLYNKNKSTVKVHFSFRVVNAEEKENELWGKVPLCKAKGNLALCRRCTGDQTRGEMG